jgi:hypothetical protein
MSAADPALPLGVLKYLYVGSADVERDLAYYQGTLGGTVIFDLRKFGAHVAAVRLGQGPLFLLADHRPAPGVLPIFVVENFEATVEGLKARGWIPKHGPFEVPDGPCYVFADPSGNELAVLGNVRPDILTGGSPR